MTKNLRILTVLVAAASLIALAGCTRGDATGSSAGELIEGVVYREVDGVELALDACLPETAPDAGSPAILVIHGGGFVAGTRDASNMRDLCLALAAEGYAAFSIDYRLAPDSIYPAQLEDAQAAIEWLRDPEQVERFSIDPTRIGVVGGSAGAVLAATLGVAGEGPLDAGSRVSAVVSLSGAMAFTSNDAATLEYLEAKGGAPYLGCVGTNPDDCPLAAEAEPIAHVDATDPPFYLLTSEEELLPEEQGELMAAALAEVGVPATARTVSGDGHATDALTREVWDEILAFLARYV